MSTHCSACFFVFVLVLAILFVGCGGEDENPVKPDPVPCSISSVNIFPVVGPWLVGEGVSILWDAEGGGEVRIALLNGGSEVGEIEDVTGNDGSYAWTVDLMSQPSGSDFGFEVVSTTDSTCRASVGGLRLMDTTNCDITVDAANDSFVVAEQTTEITWTSTNGLGTVDIGLYTSGVSGVDELVGTIASRIPDTGSFTWVVDSFHNGTYDYYRYLVSDAQVDGCEGISHFIRIIDPDVCMILVGSWGGGVTMFELGETVYIPMTQELGSGFVNLRLYSGAFPVPGGAIVDNVPINPAFEWVVTDFGHDGAHDRYHVVAIDSDDRYCVGESERFTILR